MENRMKNKYELVPDSVPENKRKHPFVVMYFWKKYMMEEVSKGRRMEDIIKEWE